MAVLSCLTVIGCGDRTGYQLPQHLDIEVRGNNRRWIARYPGADGKLRTADDVVSVGTVCVPVGVSVTLHLRSDDFIYIFLLPEENLENIAVPDLEYRLDFTTANPGSYPLEGGTMCGRPNTNHGTFASLTKDEFLDWHATAADAQ